MLSSKFKQFLFTSALMLFAYTPTFIWMWDRWWARDSYYSHGILVPIFSIIFLVWPKRKELSAIVKSSSPWGINLIVLGLIIHLGSSLMQVYFTSGFSLIITISGMVLYFFGAKTYRKVLFAVMFIVFMVPLPMIIITNVSFKLKLFAAEISAIILNSMGILAIQEGSIIKMRNAYVIVDDVCSGLRSLISLTAMGSVFAHWMKGHMLKRIGLLLTTIPIAIITNVCRIVLLSSITEVWGPEHATGFVHDASGFMVFGLAVLLLFTFGKLME